MTLCVNAARVTNYEKYGSAGVTMYSCGYSTYLQAKFSAEAKGYMAYCRTMNGLATMAGCFAYKGHNTTKNLNFLIDYCGKWYETTLTMNNITEAYQYYLENAVPLEEIPNYNFSVPITTPLKINETRIQLFRDAYEVFLLNYDDSVTYAYICIGYWGVVALIAMIFNWGAIIFPNLRNYFNGRFSILARKYVFLPALFQKKKSTSQKFLFFLDFLIPSRLESLVVFLYFWLVFVLNAVGIYYVKNDPIFEFGRFQAIIRYVADRTGIICTILIPLLVLFGGRNNFLQFLTRWKFSTVMVYHRWIARMVVLMAVIHSIGYTEAFMLYGKEDYYEDMKYNYLIWGTVATVAGSLLCFQALLFLRRGWYETFLVLHILLAIFFVVGTWYHIWEMGFAQFMYPIFAIWFFDRVVRVARLFWFGFPKAQVTLLADETVKVEAPKPKSWHATPGGHAWVHFGYGWQFWQSHPFTFIESTEGTLIFYCKVKGGITKSLYKKLQAVPGRTLSIRIGVEGPYGESHPIKHHSSAVFVAGGSGVPGLYSELKDLADHSPNSSQTLKLVWIIREWKSLSWFYKELDELKKTKVQTTIYVTRPADVLGTEELQALLAGKSDSDSNQEKEEKYSSELGEQLAREWPHIKFLEGRPSIEALVTSEIEEAANSVAFVTCGHPVMVDSLRAEVVNSVDKTKKRVDFYEALEIWA